MIDTDVNFGGCLRRVVGDIELGMDCTVRIGTDESGRYYFQIACLRKDAITGEIGMGYGGKAFLSEDASDSELVQTVFGLYKGYWEHEARETFKWRERRVFGPHIATEALWEVARRVDLRKEKEDQKHD